MTGGHSIQRRLSPSERAALLYVLSALESDEDASRLRMQTEGVLVVGGTPTMLDLSVPGDAMAVSIGDGPLPLRAIAVGDDDEPIGEIVVWIVSGRLSALEFAWYSDDPPEDWPDPDHLRIR